MGPVRTFNFCRAGVARITDQNGTLILLQHLWSHSLERQAGDGPKEVREFRDWVPVSANGNTELLVDQNGTEIDQGFDDLDRLAARDITLGSGVGGDMAGDFAYDALGRLTEAKDDDSIVQMTYDSLSARTVCVRPRRTESGDREESPTTQFPRVRRSSGFGVRIAALVVLCGVATAERTYECARLDDGAMAVVAVDDSCALVVSAAGRHVAVSVPPTAPWVIRSGDFDSLANFASLDAGRSVVIHEGGQGRWPHTEVWSIAERKLLFSDRDDQGERPGGRYSAHGACVTSDRAGIVMKSLRGVLWEWRADTGKVERLGRIRAEDELSDMLWCARGATRAYFTGTAGQLACSGFAPATGATGATERSMKVQWRIRKRAFLGWDDDDLASEDGVEMRVDDVAEYADDVGVAFAGDPWEDVAVVLGFTVSTGKPLWRRVVPSGSLAVHAPKRNRVLFVGATSARSLDPATGKDVATVEFPGEQHKAPVTAMSLAPSGEWIWRILADGRVLRTPWKSAPLAEVDASER